VPVIETSSGAVRGAAPDFVFGFGFGFGFVFGFGFGAIDQVSVQAFTTLPPFGCSTCPLM
jgi:hypothetical protein